MRSQSSGPVESSPLGSVSPLARSLYAKTDDFTKEPQGLTLSLAQHLDDTAGVAGRIWDEYLPEHLKSELADALGSSADARTTAVFLAAVHDVGKAAPAFAVQMPMLPAESIAAGLRVDPELKNYARGTRPRHETIGFLALRDWLMNEHGVARRTAKQLGMIVGAHHGAPPDHGRIDAAARDPRSMGGEPWRAVRVEFMEAAARAGFDALLRNGLPETIPTQIQSILSAVVIMADWIASNTKYFPLQDRGDTVRRVAMAWEDLALPRPWMVGPVPASAAEQLASRFGLPPNSRPRPVQDVAREAAEAMAEPGMMVVEAAMGEGKTEAALMAAEILAGRFGLGGVFVGLPSQATSNAMFDRVTDWLKHLDAADGHDRMTVFLAHNKRDLNDSYHELWRTSWEDARQNLGRHAGGGPAEEELGRARVVVHSWLAGRKRGLLAPFTIGTIDQALMASLKTKHVMLRHLGLAGKVVILDEVHAASAYMSVYLERTLTWLGALQVPVILLSATLPSARRQALVAAYEQGRGTAPESVLPTTDAYPLITTASAPGEARTHEVTAGTRGGELIFRALAPDDASLVGLLRDRLSDGGRAAVLRNTVARAQETYELLTAEFPGADVILAHARFLAFDRAQRDADLLLRFGPHARPLGNHRPQILVATQVAEQSLDLDLDLMITDLAPMDLLLQRAGRLHRHAARDPIRPEPLRRAELWVTGVDWHLTPPEPHRSYGPVYERYLLLRTLAALGIAPGRDRVATLPADIPRWVGSAYDESEAALSTIPVGWEDSVAEARIRADDHRAEREQTAKVFRLAAPAPKKDLTGWILAGLPDPESKEGHQGGGAVRDGMDSVEVLVIQRVDGEVRVPAWHPRLGGRLLPENSAPAPEEARAVLECSISVTDSMIRRGKVSGGHGSMGMDEFIGLLETDPPVLWDASRDLAGELVLALDAEGRTTIAGLDFKYSSETGMVVSGHE